MAYVAAGRFDGFYEYSLQPWDVAAGIVLINEAGGKICDFKGGDNYLFGEEIITSNSIVFNELKDLVLKYMK
jgi:myo-inositol-1(or 4)-monophosphatase